MKKLNEIVDYEFSKERTEKSKYFTEIFFGKHPMKYIELLEKYELLGFLDDTVYKVDKKYVTEEYVLCIGGEIEKDDYIYLYSFNLTNDLIEENYNEIINFIEETDEEARVFEERMKKYEKYLKENKSLDKEILNEEDRNNLRDSIEKCKEQILRLQNILLASPLNVGNYIPLKNYDYAMILFNKTTGGINYFAKDDYVGTFEIAGSFDEFIENLYIREEEKKPYTAEDVIQVRRIVESMERYAEQYDKEKEKNKNKK